MLMFRYTRCRSLNSVSTWNMPSRCFQNADLPTDPRQAGQTHFWVSNPINGWGEGKGRRRGGERWPAWQLANVGRSENDHPHLYLKQLRLDVETGSTLNRNHFSQYHSSQLYRRWLLQLWRHASSWFSCRLPWQGMWKLSDWQWHWH